MAHPGRPTKYSKEAVTSAREYYEMCLKTNQMPYIEDLCIKLQVDWDTIENWNKRHKEFSRTIKMIKLLQKRHLQNGGLGNKVNVSMAIFLLKANHGMKETIVQEVKTEDNETIKQLRDIKQAYDKQHNQVALPAKQ